MKNGFSHFSYCYQNKPNLHTGLPHFRKTIPLKKTMQLGNYRSTYKGKMSVNL